MFLIWLHENVNANVNVNVNVNVNLTEKNVIQIKSGIMINVNVSVKNIIYVKKILFGILLHVISKMVNIYQILMTIQSLHKLKL